MSESEERQPEFRISPELKSRVDLIDRIADTLFNLPKERTWNVIIEAENETRRTIQNRLLWRWHRQWAEHIGEQTKWAHGSTKLDLLLPLKLASDSARTRKRAEFEASVLALVPDREIKIGVAYDLVRSREIPVRLFADWLTDYKRVALQQGCFLKSKQDLEDEAMMRAA